jgi:ribosomal protein S18 acetylase RimI-like enzyme
MVEVELAAPPAAQALLDLMELFVSPSHRGRGLGRRALEEIDEACRELGVRALHLEVEKDNFPAAELYRQRGFEDHDRRLMTKRTEGG